MNIKIQDLQKTYDQIVLKRIDFEIQDCKSIAIIGPSGSGKSTLLRLLAAIEYPENGTIIINDYEINEESKKMYQQDIGLVFQKHNLFPHLSLRRNITLILERVKGIAKEEANDIAVSLLTDLQLDDQMDKLPKNVSGGQAQRASIARALATDPSIIFLDEPTAALDPILTNEVLQAVLKLRDSGKDFVFVTHEISFVRDFADYVIYLHDGVIKEHGEVTILDSPKTKELSDFVAIVK